MNERERIGFHRDFERALVFATRLHAPQTRKQTEVPYLSHLLGVSGLVLEFGGNRDEAIAALLHDSIEDQGTHYPGGVPALKKTIASEFGQTVLDIVEGCTDSETEPKPPWRARKEAYIRRLRDAGAAVRLVSCADKLHNARSIVTELHVVGRTLFDRFTGGEAGTLWYYRELSVVFTELGPAAPAEELSGTVATMIELSSAQRNHVTNPR